jgi:lysophospholipase L1-like esterase
MQQHRKGRAHRRLRPLIGVLVLTALVLSACVVLPVAATGQPVRPYLALGDSITFGYVAQPPASAGYDPYSDPARFVAYPAYVARALALDVIDAACPGETSGSLIALGAADNGCRGYRASHPLHVDYAGRSQLQYAETFLQTYPTTQLVTLGIGLNDGLLVLARCGGPAAAACINARMPAAVDAVRGNIGTIVRALRAAGYHGRVVLMDYYSVDSGNAAYTMVVTSLNQAIAGAGAAFGLRVAGVFTAFDNAAVRSGGDTCAAGLLQAALPAATACDLHPSLTGQQLIAATVVRAVAGAG